MRRNNSLVVGEASDVMNNISKDLQRLLRKRKFDFGHNGTGQEKTNPVKKNGAATVSAVTTTVMEPIHDIAHYIEQQDAAEMGGGSSVDRGTVVN